MYHYYFHLPTTLIYTHFTRNTVQNIKRAQVLHVLNRNNSVKVLSVGGASSGQDKTQHMQIYSN